jgi:hypothetical protein
MCFYIKLVVGNSFTYKVIINLNMFRSSMKNYVLPPLEHLSSRQPARSDKGTEESRMIFLKSKTNCECILNISENPFHIYPMSSS